ncbi:ABC transporter ATP-binding protein [Sulfurirhabdus autotrophica]|uniref:Cu-processing system ATP-binding protein n=1 Tax=Sulfurirhabdus autotrophica TaxID=1706046 RepID=A0A4R3XVR7_9PROT|nr:ABC transporter ATP-binding protein [Sulfurirhabdus autotrophica]TCV83270.1 Cu-processing system ATP-binding protein [Sulfurirhabdus autotrophica]
MKNNVIEVNAVAKQFGEIRAVGGVDLAVQEGEIFGLIGHNGAGKSTLFKMMLGLLPASEGEIRILGKSIQGEAFRQVRRNIGYLPENVVFYDNLTGLETLGFFADLKSVSKNTCAELLDKVGLSHAANRRVRGYSKGMRQRLGFAQALLGKPAILFLDEPTTGLDPEGIREFYQILREMREQGVTVILTSHILAEIQERVDRLAIMKMGKIQALGTVQSLRDEMDLPLIMQIKMQPGTLDDLKTALLPLGLDEAVEEDGKLLIRCPRNSKMAALSIIAGLDGKVADLHVREPSLEDVFLGYSG